MLPQALPVAAPVQPPVAPPPGAEPTLGGGNGSSIVDPVTRQPEPPSSGPQKMVQLSFSTDRDQLYVAWSALGNLADMAGKVSVSVTAESQQGFDRTKLNNGVLEPLREADLIE